MPAIVCGKRSNIFEESPSSPSVTKRICCSSSSSPGRTFSPPRASHYFFPDPAIDHLVALFPDMDRQLLEKALEESGDDLDSAIKRLNELCLSATPSTSDPTHEIDSQFMAKGTTSTEDPPQGSNLPSSGAEWVELLVGKVLSASNVEDAKARLSRGLEALEMSIRDRAVSEAANSFQKEILMLKQQLEAVLQENAILKRAVAVQHERQKVFDEMGQELHQLKQLVPQYQEQLRTLEMNNYALAMHLKQAQQSSSLPGRFHPDVF